MSRMTLFNIRPIVMYIKTLPLERIVKIRFAMAKFLYETATLNGRLNAPRLDDVESALDTGIRSEEIDAILNSLAVNPITDWMMAADSPLRITRNDKIGFEDHQILSTIIMLVRENTEILFHEKENMSFLPTYTSDVSRIELSLIYAGIDPSETYPIIVSLMGMTMS